jgi:hypothetical protein
MAASVSIHMLEFFMLKTVLSMENSSMWINILALEFDVLDEEVVICGDEQESVEQEGDVEVVDTMVLLLTEGLPDDAEKVV